LSPLDFVSISKDAGSIKDYKIERFILYPVHWQNYPNTIPLTWERLQFTQANAKSVPDDQAGVYSFVAVPGIGQHPSCNYLLYIGMTEKQTFRDRYSQYLREENKRKPRMHILKMLKNFSDHLWFYYAPIAEKNLIRQIEDELITALLPPYNYEYPASIKTVMELVFK